VQFVNQPGVVEAAEHLRTAFDEHIRHPPPPEFAQQIGDGRTAISLRQFQNLAAAPRCRITTTGCRRQQQRHFAGCRQQPAAVGQFPRTRKHNPHGDARPRRTGGQQRVVGPDRAGTDDDGVHPAAEFVDQPPRRVAADPLGMPRPRGDLAVERHRPLGMDIRPVEAE
jgi:hypothetical protein